MWDLSNVLGYGMIEETIGLDRIAVGIGVLKHWIRYYKWVMAQKFWGIEVVGGFGWDMG